MPLLDHFHPPLSGSRHWESFHAAWAGSIADLLNRDLLPTGYFAEEHVHVGSRVEVDVATFDGVSTAATEAGGGTLTLQARPWTAPAPMTTWPAIFPDSLEVLIFSSEAGPTLVAAVELVSLGNKDRPEYRRAFAAKCASYLHQGIGLIVVDIVTDRLANLHGELATMLGVQVPAGQYAPLYTAAYQPLRCGEDEIIDLWFHQLELGGSLPVLPLALDKGVVVPLDLETTYNQACQRRRIAQYPRPVI